MFSDMQEGFSVTLMLTNRIVLKHQWMTGPYWLHLPYIGLARREGSVPSPPPHPTTPYNMLSVVGFIALRSDQSEES